MNTAGQSRPITANLPIYLAFRRKRSVGEIARSDARNAELTPGRRVQRVRCPRRFWCWGGEIRVCISAFVLPIPLPLGSETIFFENCVSVSARAPCRRQSQHMASS
jgi:hypothetical protein